MPKHSLIFDILLIHLSMKLYEINNLASFSERLDNQLAYVVPKLNARKSAASITKRKYTYIEIDMQKLSERVEKQISH
ncbi:UNVERIFIED_CONTAM: hypothetical protein NCL1_08650 [Trichonephila clavipes]